MRWSVGGLVSLRETGPRPKKTEWSGVILGEFVGKLLNKLLQHRILDLQGIFRIQSLR